MALNLVASPSSNDYDLRTDRPWESLYSFLRPRVTHWVHSSSLSSWSKQREDIITDIIQEAITRTLRYAQRAERGEVTPIDSLEHLGLIVAYNCFRDLWRRDRCLVTIIRQDYVAKQSDAQSALSDQLDLALNNVFQEWLFVRLASEIIRFPDKQRNALLTDLANRMYFGKQPTILQRAFLEVGIRLQDYQQELPEDAASRGRHASLLSLAYKRLARVASNQTQPN